MASGWLAKGTVKHFKHGSLVIQDSGGSNSVTVTLEDGGVSWNSTNPYTWHKNRGVLDHRIAGEQVPMEVSFKAKYTGLYSNTADVSPYEALKKVGGASGWTSTTSTTSDVYSVDLVLTYTEPIDSNDKETLTFDDFAEKSVNFTEGEEGNMLEFTGDCSTVKPVITGSSTG